MGSKGLRALGGGVQRGQRPLCVAARMLTVLVDGIASGMLLFVLAVGLSVTLGLMNFVNLAHGAFGMAGGYVCVLLLNRQGLPFPLCLLAAAAFAALLGLVLERLLYRRLY